VFSTHTGVLARTLVGHESGVWGVCLVGKGGWREGGEAVKEVGRGSSNERREMKERKKQKQRERQSEREDRETTPRPSKESASVTLVVDPDSKKPRRRKDTEKGKEKDGEKEERKSRRTTPPNEPPIVGHIRVEANDRIRDEPPRGSSSSSHHEMRPGPSSATTAVTPASAGTSKTRRASISPTTPKRPRKYPSTIPHGLQDQPDEFQDLSILHPVESGLAGETFPILSAGVGASSAPATATASTIADESEEAHSKSRHDTHQHPPHHHHPQHHRRSRRNSTVNQGGTSTTPRNNDSANRRAEHVEPNANPHPHQRGSVPKGDGMHAMPGESLAHLLPAALRVSLGLPAVAAGSDASGASSDSEDEEAEEG